MAYTPIDYISDKNWKKGKNYWIKIDGKVDKKYYFNDFWLIVSK